MTIMSQQFPLDSLPIAADPQPGRKSMELMAEKVMPAVNAALARPMAAE